MSRSSVFTLPVGPVHVLPVLHGSLECAQVVVEAAQRLRPAAVAVELPKSLTAPLTRAIRRLPQITAVRYRTGAGRLVYYLIEPADPIFEAARFALERDLPLHFVDLDLDDYPEHRDAVPDPYAIARIGHRAFVEAYLAATGGQIPDAEDARRERAMAVRLGALADGPGPALFVCGMAHARRIAEALAERPAGRSAEPLDRLSREHVALFNVDPDSTREVLVTWSYLQAAYERGRAAALGRGAPAGDEAPETRVLSLRPRPGEPRRQVVARRADPDALPVDRQQILARVFAESRERYQRVTGDKIKPYHRRTFFKFLRNWTLTHGRLQPELYQIVIAARSSADDNFAYELWNLATHWPWQKAEAEIPTLPLSLEELMREHSRVRFRPTIKVRRLRALGGRRDAQLGPEAWLQGFKNANATVSYPPEDVAVEAFADYVARKATNVVSEENRRIEPFTTSLLDGIDLRETMRHWHEAQLYVQELRRGPGNVGTVVIVFDEDPSRERYPWDITWLGEHAQEGDMALYATAPLDQIVGPGICRCEYGGFLLTHPPGRMTDVWSDEAYERAESRKERLLLAAIDYSVEKVVAYIAARPPRAELKQVAERFGRKLLYLPIGGFSPATLKKLRVFHVLFGRDKREIARSYVW